MSDQTQSVLTIGHSTHSLETFVALLRRHGVTAVADVRSTPYSRFNPQFNKDALERGLRSNNMRYAALGHQLGGRSNDPSCYRGGRVQYAQLARTESFRAGLERIIRGSREHRIALMCAEKEPLECHRTILVSRHLVERGVAVDHILADGTLECHEATMGRLMDIVGVPPQDLFRTREQLVEEALARQEQRIAYLDESFALRAGGEAQ